MKIANVLLLIALLAIAPVLILQRRAVQSQKQERIAVEEELRQQRAKAAADAAQGESNSAELAKLREQQSELIRLRGEVTNLRREKEELTKKLALAEKKAAEHPAAPAQSAQAATPEAGPQPGMLASEAGRLRRKALSGERLSETEMAFLTSLQPKVSEIEKTPEAFAEFQSAQLAAMFGWPNGDPRIDQVKAVLNAASRAANTRGLTFNAPGQTYDTWDDAHKMLDNRATGAVKKLLTPEEQAAFDGTFSGIMNANVLAGPRK